MGKIIRNNYRKWIEMVMLPILLVAGFFAVYSWIGYERGLQWHSLRKGLEAIVILWAVSVMTQCSLKEKLWRPAYMVLFMYALVYPTIISIGRKGWITDFDFAAPYFLIAVSAASLITVFLYIGQASRKLGYLFNFLATFLAALLFLNTLIYIGYFCVYHTPFVAADMLAIIQTNASEARQFIEGQIGLLPLLLGAILTVSFAGMFAYLIKLSTHTKAKKSNAVNDNQKRKLLCAVIVLVCGYLIYYWGGKSYPYNEYRMAKSYVSVVQRAQKEHGEAVKKLELLHGTNQTLPKQLPGTVIFIIGESENRDHMSAFNPSYPAETTPWLSRESQNRNFVLLANGYANYPQTTPSLEMALTGVNQYNHQNLETAFNIVDVAKAAGYDTWWLSNQSKMGDGTTAAGLVASWTDHHVWTNHPMGDDMELLNLLKNVPKEGNHFIIIHLGGSHLRYAERVPVDLEGIQIEGNSERTNDYDTTVLYTDQVIKAIFEYAQQNLSLQALVYSSDHGEDMVYSHGAGKFTYDMVRIPIFFYLSPDYMQAYEKKVENLKRNQKKVFTNDLLYDTISGMISAENNQYESKYDLFSTSYELTAGTALTKHGQERIDRDIH